MFVNALKKLSPRFQLFTGAFELRKQSGIAQRVEYERQRALMAAAMPGNVALQGGKVYSQTDEDGVIAEIFRRIDGTSFMEIGVQTGIECNSLALLLGGWRGMWVEGSAKYCATIERSLGARDFPGRFRIRESFVKRDNIASLYREAVAAFSVPDIDFFSLDIDGNDLHVLNALLGSGARPRVLCVEYQAKFPPPLNVAPRYADDHVWDGSDYMGSSLQAFADMLGGHEYRLLACNIPGINAFFVRADLADAFDLYPIAQVYQPYRWYLSPFHPAQPPSTRYLRDLLRSGA